MTDRRDQAIELFAPLGPRYDRLGALLSFGQDPRWRRAMVSHIPRDGGSVLDVATGTGLVAERLLAEGHRVTGLDQSPDMLAVARSRFGDRVELVEASATAIPFADASFDHLTFTYLLRYVDDPAATLAELARVVRPGGTIANLEFCVPRGIWRPLWDLYVGVGLPALGRIASKGWYDVGRFLGPSIRGFYERWPLERQLELWRDAGVTDVQARRMSVGGGVVIWGTKDVRPAFYALRRGGWRDYVTLLHAPYTAWHLSYVVVGGCLVAEVSWGRLGLTVLAFFLAMGIGAHALDELAGRPLQTAIPGSVLVALAVVSVVAACAIGLAVAISFSLWILPLIAIGAFLVPAYNLELFGGRFHSDLWFAACVGRVPRRHGRRRVCGHRPRRDRDRRRLGDRPLAGPAPALDSGQAKPPGGRRRDR